MCIFLYSLISINQLKKDNSQDEKPDRFYVDPTLGLGIFAMVSSRSGFKNGIQNDVDDGTISI